VQSLRVNGERLWSTVTETARFGGTAGGGITRLTLSDEDRDVRDWFVARCKAIGCTVTVDEVGNIFARRSGFDNTRQPIAFGSHLDTQPSGGKFDGVAGVLVGLEMLRTLDEHHVTTTAPWSSSTGPTRRAPGLRPP
jgi:N-carbamoyl-L-amino-acid hydrolase